MGKALVLNNVDFGANRLTTVTLLDAVPCRGISLNEDALVFTSVGQRFTLVPSLLPANTTDAVAWSVSDPAVATVAGGTVTQTGVGSCVITAACGEQSASCAVTATNLLTYECFPGQIAAPFTGRDYVTVSSAGGGEHYAAVAQASPATAKRVYSDSGYLYPIPLGGNASVIRVTCPAGIRCTVQLLNCDEPCDYSADHPAYATYAKRVAGEDVPYDTSVPLGNREIRVPQGANSAVFTFQKPGAGNAMTAEDFENISVTVG